MEDEKYLIVLGNEKGVYDKKDVDAHYDDLMKAGAKIYRGKGTGTYTVRVGDQSDPSWTKEDIDYGFSNLQARYKNATYEPNYEWEEDEYSPAAAQAAEKPEAPVYKASPGNYTDPNAPESDFPAGRPVQAPLEEAVPEGERLPDWQANIMSQEVAKMQRRAGATAAQFDNDEERLAKDRALAESLSGDIANLKEGKRESRKAGDREMKRAYKSVAAQRQAQLDEVLSRIDQNPAYAQQLEQESKAVEEKKTALSEIRTNAYDSLVRKYGRDNMQYISVQNEPEMRNVEAAGRLYDDALQTINAPLKFDQKQRGDGRRDFGKGMADDMKNPDFWTLGLTNIEDKATIREALLALQDVAGKVTQDEIANLDDLDLDETQKAVIDAYFTAQAANVLRSMDTSNMYQAGIGGAESLKFMAEMALTAGIGKAATEGLTKKMVSFFGKKLAQMSPRTAVGAAGKWALRQGAKLATNQVAALTKAGVMTLAQPVTYENIAERGAQVDEWGKVTPLGKAAAQGGADQFIETWTEMSGELPGQFLGAAFDGVARALGTTAKGKALVSAMRNSSARMLGGKARQLIRGSKGLVGIGWNNAGEYFEELLGAGIRDITGLEPGATDEFFQVQNLLDMTATFAPMAAIGLVTGTMNVGRSVHYANKLRQTEDALRAIVGDANHSDKGLDRFFDKYYRWMDSRVGEEDRRVPGNMGYAESEDLTAQDMATDFMALYQERAADMSPEEKGRALEAMTDFIKTMQQAQVVQGAQEADTDADGQAAMENARAEMLRDFVYKGSNDYPGSEVVTGRIMVPDPSDPSGRIGSDTVFIVGDLTSTGEYPVVYPGGRTGFVNADDIGGIQTYAPGEYGRVLASEQKTAAEQERIAAETQGQVSALMDSFQQRYPVGASANELLANVYQMNGETAPEWIAGGDVLVSDMNEQGVTFMNDKGASVNMSWEELAPALGGSVEVKTDADAANEAAGMLDAEDEARNMTAAQLDEAIKQGIVLEQTGEQVVGIIKDSINLQDGTCKATVRDRDGNERVIPFVYSEVLAKQQQAPAEAPEELVPEVPAEAPAPAEEPAPAAPAEPQAPAYETPMKDGEVDWDKMLDENPAEFARQLDELNGGDSTMSKAAISARLKELKEKLAKTKPTKVNEIMKLKAQIKALEDVQKSYLAQNQPRFQQAPEKKTEEVELAPGFDGLVQKFQGAPKKVGFAHTKTLPDGTKLKGHYVLLDANAVTASHDPANGWQPTEGFPLSGGQSANSRDYTKPANRTDTEMMAQRYDGRALESIPTVTPDGIVVDGNGRTMASQLAAKNGTDTAYNETLREEAQRFGFTEEDVSGFDHPRVVFVTDEALPYDVGTFDMFNAREQKRESKSEAANKIGRLLDLNKNANVVANIASYMDQFDTVAQFYEDPAAVKEVFNLLVGAGVFSEKDRQVYISGKDGKATDEGKAAMNNVFLGIALDKNAIEILVDVQGMGKITEKVVKALPSIIENSAFSDRFNLKEDLSKAIELYYHANQSYGDSKDPVRDYLNTPQIELGGAFPAESEEVQYIARALQTHSPNKFKDDIAAYNKNVINAEQGVGALDFGEESEPVTKASALKNAIFTRNNEEYEPVRNQNEEVPANEGGGVEVGDMGPEGPGAVQTGNEGGTGAVVPGAAAGNQGQPAAAQPSGAAHEERPDTTGNTRQGAGEAGPAEEQPGDEYPTVEGIFAEAEGQEKPGVVTYNGIEYVTGGLTGDDMAELWANKDATKEADKGKPGRVNITRAIFDANPKINTFENEGQQLIAIENVYRLAQEYPNLAISKEILGRVKETPENEQKPAKNSAENERKATEKLLNSGVKLVDSLDSIDKESAQPGDVFAEISVDKNGFVKIKFKRAAVNSKGKTIIGTFSGLRFTSLAAEDLFGDEYDEEQLGDLDLSSAQLISLTIAPDGRMTGKVSLSDMDGKGAGQWDLTLLHENPLEHIGEQLTGREREVLENLQESSEDSSENISESPKESVSSQKEEPVSEPAESEAPKQLTEEQIRNSGYPDENVIEAAVDYINGDTSFQAQLGYLTIEDYVRSNSQTTQGSGQGANETQLPGEGTPAGSAQAGRGGGQTVPVVPEPVGGPRREDRPQQDAPVLPGERGADVVPQSESGRGNQPAGNNNGRGRGVSGANGPQRNPVGGESAGGNLFDGEDQGRGNQTAPRNTDAGSLDEAALGAELTDLLGQLEESSPLVSTDRLSTVEGILEAVSYMETAPKTQPTAKDAPLSSKRTKRIPAPLSLNGMEPKRALLLGKIMFTSAKAGYAHAANSTETSYRDFSRWFKAQFGKVVTEKLGEESLEPLILAAWDTKLKIHDTRLTLAEYVENMHNLELRLSSDIKENLRKQASVNDDKTTIKLGDRKDIKESLPALNPGQWDDVALTERQFFGEEHNDYDHAFGKGTLVTNGTGTGKTFTGMGVIKRFLRQGKNRILLVTPANMVDDWDKTAKLFGVKINKLENTKDKGEGVIITSYENFRANRELYKDTFDLVVYDEAQKIIYGQAGDETLAYIAHRRITNKNIDEATDRLVYTTPVGQQKLALEQEKEKLDREAKKKTVTAERSQEIILRQREIDTELETVNRQVELLKPSLREKAREAVKKTKVLMLSASPFNTLENLKFAEGYIFNYPKVYRANGTENTSDKARKAQFDAEWFGGDNHEQDEIDFADHLIDELETVQFRELENGYDHSRDFPDVSGMVMAERFNQAWEAINNDGNFLPLRKHAGFLTDYAWSSQLFEVMKVSALRDRIQEHLDAGRKIVLFHNRLHETKITSDEDGSIKKPPVGPPFKTLLSQAMFDKDATMASILFQQQFKDVLEWEDKLDYRPVPDQMIDLFATKNDRAKYQQEMEAWRKAHDKWEKENRPKLEANPDAKVPAEPKEPKLQAESICLFNGEMTEKQKNESKALFNDDNSKKKIIIVTTASGGAGLSLHDTTGKHQRVMIQTSLPNSPIGFIQAEGRIFRFGNKSNAVFEYPRLGLNLEAYVFAMNFNKKVGTTENLAHGTRGRGFKDSIMTGFFENSGIVPIAGQGIGGVELDKRGSTLKDMAKALHDYEVSQRKGITQEDTAVPEPVGYKMAQWAKTEAGENALVPYAGRGSVPRYIPAGVDILALESNTALQTRMAITAGREELNIKETGFDVLHSGANKADVVFIQGATNDPAITPVGAFAKGFQHLNEGGRIIAVLPDTEETDAAVANLGPAAARRLSIKVAPGLLGEEPKRIVMVDKITDPKLRAKATKTDIDLSGVTDQTKFFQQIDLIEAPDRIVDKDAIAARKMKALIPQFKSSSFIDDMSVSLHYKTGAPEGINIHYKTKKGFKYAKKKLEDFTITGSYRGNYEYIRMSEFRNPNQFSDLVKAYTAIKDILLEDDAELRRYCRFDADVNAETVADYRKLLNMYLKLIRAGYGYNDSQMMRVAAGMQADVSAADITSISSLTELREKFQAAVGDDEEYLKMFDDVLPVSEKAGVKVTSYQESGNFLGEYNNVKNELRLNVETWNKIPDEKRAQTALHELIHSVTVYAIQGAKNGVAGMSDALYNAANSVVTVFEQLQKGDPRHVRMLMGYALQNEKELMAEMANPDVRAKLKERPMWTRETPRGTIVSGAEQEGFEQTTAWDLLNLALHDILNNFDQTLFDRYRNRKSDVFFSLDRQGRTLESDGGIVFNANNDNFVEYEEDADRAGAARDGNDSWGRNREGLDERDTRKVEIRRDKGSIRVLETRLAPTHREYPDSSEGNFDRRSDQEREGKRLIETAKSEGLFIEPGSFASLPRIPGQSRESIVYNDKQNGRVIKIMDPFAAESMSNNSPFDELYRHIIHNIYFPESRYEFLGVTTNHRGDEVRFVLAQPWVDSYERVTDAEADRFIKEHGFGPLDGYKRQNDDVVVFDFYGSNILKDADGNLHLIDPMFSFKRDPRDIINEYLGDEGARYSFSDDTGIPVSREEVENAATDLGASMHTKVVFEDSAPAHARNIRGSMVEPMGWYDTTDNSIHLNMGRVRSVEQAQSVVLHETVGHYGLRALFGKDFDNFLDNVYNNATQGIKDSIDAIAKDRGLNRRTATEEYLAMLAEEGFSDIQERSFWQNVKDWFVDMLGAAGVRLSNELTDADLRYILWESKRNLEQGDVLQSAENAITRAQLREEAELSRAPQPAEDRVAGIQQEIDGVDRFDPSYNELQERKAEAIRQRYDEIKFPDYDLGVTTRDGFVDYARAKGVSEEEISSHVLAIGIGAAGITFSNGEKAAISDNIMTTEEADRVYYHERIHEKVREEGPEFLQEAIRAFGVLGGDPKLTRDLLVETVRRLSNGTNYDNFSNESLADEIIAHVLEKAYLGRDISEVCRAAGITSRGEKFLKDYYEQRKATDPHRPVHILPGRGGTGGVQQGPQGASGVQGEQSTAAASARDREGRRDAEYLAAVKRGDLATAQRIVNEVAQEHLDEFNALQSDEGTVTYKYHRGPMPKKWRTVYKALNVDELGGMHSTYAGVVDAIPFGVALDAQSMDYVVSPKNGRRYVPGTTGNTPASLGLPKPPAPYTSYLSFRPAFHASSVPWPGQMRIKGPDTDAKKNEYRYLPHNKLIFKVEVAADVDYESQAEAFTEQLRAEAKARGDNGTIRKQLWEVPVGGHYTYNNGGEEWVLAGTFRIVGVLSEDEIRRLNDDAGKPNTGSTQLLWVDGYHPEEFGLTDAAVTAAVDEGMKSKLLDAVTYDDNGNPIPPSQRFNPQVNDIRYSFGDSKKYLGNSPSRASRALRNIHTANEQWNIARHLYNTMVNTPESLMKEQYQNMYESVHVLMNAIETESGRKAKDFEDFRLLSSAVPSKNKRDHEVFGEKYLDPMNKAIADLTKTEGVDYDDVVKYAELKHGLERNIEMARRNAMADYEADYRKKSQKIRDDIEAAKKEMDKLIKGGSYADMTAKAQDRYDELSQYVKEKEDALQDLLDEYMSHRKALYPKEYYREMRDNAIRDIKANDALTHAEKGQLIDEENRKYEAVLEDIANNPKKYEAIRDNDVRFAHYRGTDGDKDNLGTDYAAIRSWFSEYQDANGNPLSETPIRLSGETKDEYNGRLRSMRHIMKGAEKLTGAEAMAQAWIDEFEKKVGKEGYENLWNAVNGATGWILKHQLDNHSISREQYDALSERFKYYVPLRGFSEDTAEDLWNYGQEDHSGDFAAPLLPMQGRQSKPAAPFAYIATMADTAIVTDNRNSLRRALYRFVANRPDNSLVTIADSWYVNTHQKDDEGHEIWEPSYPSYVPGMSQDEMRAARDAFEQNMRDMAAAGEAILGSKGLNLRGAVAHIDSQNRDRHLVKVLMFGKEHFLIVNGNPRAALALNGQLNIESLNNNAVLRVFRDVTRIMSMANTGLSPSFWFANFAKDFITGSLNTAINEDAGYLAKFEKNYAVAVSVIPTILKGGKFVDNPNWTDRQRARMKKYADLYSMYLKNGGPTGFTTISNIEQYESLIRSAAKKNKSETVAKIQRLWNGLTQIGKIGEALEQVPRFAAFLTSMEEGRSIERSVRDAKDVTLDFNTKGAASGVSRQQVKQLQKMTKSGAIRNLTALERAYYLGILNLAPSARSLIMFFNPAVQGVDKMIRNFKNSPGKAAAVTGALVFAGFARAVFASLFPPDDEDNYSYNDLNEYRKRTNFVIPVGPIDILWPISQEFAPFYALGDIIAGLVLHRNGPSDKPVLEALETAGSILPLNPFSPMDFVPDLLTPIIEVMRNRNFMGSYIYYDYASNKDLPGYTKAPESTWGWLVDASQMLNDITGGDYARKGWLDINPAVVQHLAEGVGGGILRDLGNLTQEVENVTKGDDFKLRNTMVLRRFALDPREYRNAYVYNQYTQYYNAAMEAKRLHNKYKDDVVRQIELEDSKEWEYYQIYRNYESEIKSLREERDAAEDSRERADVTFQLDSVMGEFVSECSEVFHDKGKLLERKK